LKVDWGRVVSFIEGDSRDQISLLPACIDDYVALDAARRIADMKKPDMALPGSRNSLTSMFAPR
jgi:hypothetical protein